MPLNIHAILALLHVFIFKLKSHIIHKQTDRQTYGQNIYDGRIMYVLDEASLLGEAISRIVEL